MPLQQRKCWTTAAQMHRYCSSRMRRRPWENHQLTRRTCKMGSVIRKAHIFCRNDLQTCKTKNKILVAFQLSQHFSRRAARCWMQIKWLKGTNWQIRVGIIEPFATLPRLISLLWALIFGRENWGTAILQETCSKLSPQIRAAVPNLRYVPLISRLISCFDVSLSITHDLSDVQFVYSKTEDLTLVTTCSLERGNTSGKLNSKYWKMLYYRPHRGFRRKTTEVMRFLCCQMVFSGFAPRSFWGTSPFRRRS